MERRPDLVLVRPQAYQDELTPASSGPNSLNSPVSAGSGPRSPWPNVRKGSLPGPRRPPSPELSNLDCAFPPFPTRAATTRKRERAMTQRSEGKRSRSRDANKGNTQSSRRPALTREGSSNISGTKSSDTLQTLKQSRPASPLSNEIKLESRGEGVEILSDSQLPALESPAVIESHSAKPLPESLATLQVTAPLDAQSQQSGNTILDPGLSTFDFGGSVISKSAQPKLESDLHDRVRADTEPTYKSKRPPPLLSNQEIMPLAKSSTAPQPSPSASIGRSFGRLFSRRRSQSAISRRDVVRQALSDEPDSLDKNSAGQSILSPGSDRSFFTAEPSPLATSPLMSPESALSRKGSAGEPEEITHDPAVATPTVVIDEPAIARSKRSGQVLLPSLYVMPPPEPSETFDFTSSNEGSELIEALRRASIDSASSYGSIGFTERTTSSRSTAPHVDMMPIEMATHPDSVPIASADVDVPAPLRPKIPELMPDSPTDPLFQQGRLSPIPPSADDQEDLLDELLSQQMGRRAGPEPALDPQLSPSNTLKPQVPNKGTCRGCSKLILTGQKSVSSADGQLSGRYHKECFVCHTCKISFPTAEFYVHNDHPYCGHHYHELSNSLCATCGNGIEGLYMETANVAGRGKEKHHPECLKCTTCRVRLDHDYFELSGKVYCERDAFRLAMVPKSHDNAPSRPSPLIREYISSGDPGLLKGRNFPERRTTRLMTMI